MSNSGYNTADVYVAYNVQYGPQTSNGIARCKGIIAQNSLIRRTGRRTG